MTTDIQRTLLLVDDEENILRSLRRLLRRDGYKILTAGSGAGGLALLRENSVGVVISDQRMPEMNGSEFLERVTDEFPATVRIILSGYTDLETVTDSINRGAIYKFLTKPWDDDLLRQNVTEAFRIFELNGENQRLTDELQTLNHSLEQRIAEKTRALEFNLNALKVAQNILHELPLAVMGISEDEIVLVNRQAFAALSSGGAVQLGQNLYELEAPELLRVYDKAKADKADCEGPVMLNGQRYYCSCQNNQGDGAHQGFIITLRLLS